MSDTAARLLSLLSLLQTPREWPGSELAARLAVSPRTIRRDIERLRDLGYPVEATMGATGGYRLVAGSAMPPLLLDDEEAVAIAVGLRTAAGQAVSGIEDASLRALAKLSQVLPLRLRHRVNAMSAATQPLLVWAEPTVEPETLVALGSAIALHERVRFRYLAADAGETRRLVEPYSLVAAGRRWYLVAYDNDRAGWRFFRVDRLRRLEPTGSRFPARDLPGDDAATFVARRLSDLAPTYQAVVTLHLPAAQAARLVGEFAADLHPIDALSCRLVTPADTLDWLAFRLLLLNCEVTVEQPRELIVRMRHLSARAARAAGVR